MHINDKTYVPIAWLIVSVLTMGSLVATGAFWVKGVDDRLQRIENKLDIQVAITPSPYLNDDSEYALNR